MNIKLITEKLKSPEYDFLKTDPHLGDHIILLGLGGSHAYGTNMKHQIWISEVVQSIERKKS